MSKANKKAAPGATRKAASKTNTRNHTAPAIIGQLHFHGFAPPPPERAEGCVADYLFARPGWHERMRIAAALMVSDRDVREQAEHSGGAVIFGSGRGQGLKHISHADAWEIRACAAELRYRAKSHLCRADEVERAGGLAR